jgi:hypothetical protein
LFNYYDKFKIPVVVPDWQSPLEMSGVEAARYSSSPVSSPPQSPEDHGSPGRQLTYGQNPSIINPFGVDGSKYPVSYIYLAFPRILYFGVPELSVTWTFPLIAISCRPNRPTTEEEGHTQTKGRCRWQLSSKYGRPKA